MAATLVRVLVIDDCEAFREFLCSTLEDSTDIKVISQVSDGLQAVEQAETLQPDLILLDIGLPELNGIEAARRIRRLSPNSKILFVSQESSPYVVRTALGTGALGYVVKADAGSELLTAIKALLRADKFVGKRFAGQDLTVEKDAGALESDTANKPPPGSVLF